MKEEICKNGHHYFCNESEQMECKNCGLLQTTIDEPTKPQWEEEFDEKFELRMNGCSECGGADLLENGKDIYDLDSIKSFIHHLLEKGRQEARDEVIRDFATGAFIRSKEAEKYQPEN